MTRPRVIWLVCIFLALHNLEEALTFPRYPALLAGLVVVTVIPIALSAWANARPASRAALRSVVVVQAIVALNVVWHVAAGFVRRDYVPGLVTAVLINLPFSIYFFRRAKSERWLA